MSSAIQEGWDFTSKQMGSGNSAVQGAEYVNTVDNAIKELAKDINAKTGTTQGIGQLKGFIAEYWHAGTFNINAVLRGSKNRATVEGSNLHASVDVSTNFGNDYSMKYYADAKSSAVNQAKNVIQAYHEYLSKSQSDHPMSFAQYIKKYGYSSDMQELLMSVYNGQGRIIPSDQLSDAVKYLEKQIVKEAAKEGENRAALLTGYKETLSKLSDRIKDGEGAESIPLSKEEAEAIAALAKEGDFNPESFGLGLKDLVTSEYLLHQALQAGYSSALITLVMQVAPEIFKSFDYLLKNGKLNVEEIKKFGITAISSSAEGFLRGSISAALTISCKTGKLGSKLINIDPHLIGMVTVIAIDTVKNSILMASGKMTPKEMGTVLTKEIILSSVSLASGTIGQIVLPELPVLGYMLGSFLGSCIASVALNIGEKRLISFCVYSGFTCFGLVDQNYELPRDILKKMGIDIAVIPKSSVAKTPINRTAICRNNIQHTRYETIEIVMVRRGVIGVNKIGYIG